jgi:regulatory protein
MSFDASRDSRTPRRARPRQSLKMQAIGFLSRREHSRQELRVKLLDSLRQRAREDAALAAAAEELAKATQAQAQLSNGIDDAFAPNMPASEPALAGRHALASRAGAPARDRMRGRPRDGDTQESGDSHRRRDQAHDLALDAGQASSRGHGHDQARAAHGQADAGAGGGGGVRPALDTLRLATGAALPSRLRASLVAVARGPDDGAGPQAPAASGLVIAPAGDDADLQRSDPEAAVDQLLDWLVVHKYLSDERFVESRVNARSRKQGTLRIKLELSRHGLALEPQQAAALRETEFARAQALWQRKFGEVASDPKQRAKQARFLASRGFAADVVRRVVGGEEEF